MTQEKLQEILQKHKLWLNDEDGGERADLRYADLSSADLRSANLRSADLRSADLRSANLRYADLRSADLRSADLRSADLRSADLRYADLRSANLRYADLRYADLRSADLSSADLRSADLRSADLRSADLRSADLRSANLRYADLRSADLSQTKGVLSTVNYLEANFERVADGYIAYKTFGGQRQPPETWKIEKGSIIEETVNFDRCTDCGSGINVAPIEWVRKNYKGDIWKVLIRWEWLCGVCVPYMTDGKIRCEKVELIEITN